MNIAPITRHNGPMIRVWIAYALLAALTAYCATDCIHTYIALQAGLQEANPLMRWVICNLGFQFMIFIKLLWIAFLAVLIYAAAAKYLK